MGKNPLITFFLLTAQLSADAKVHHLTNDIKLPLSMNSAETLCGKRGTWSSTRPRGGPDAICKRCEKALNDA